MPEMIFVPSISVQNLASASVSLSPLPILGMRLPHVACTSRSKESGPMYCSDRSIQLTHQPTVRRVAISRNWFDHSRLLNIWPTPSQYVCISRGVKVLRV